MAAEAATQASQSLAPVLIQALLWLLRASRQSKNQLKLAWVAADAAMTNVKRHG
jgi:hypothetical protein